MTNRFKEQFTTNPGTDEAWSDAAVVGTGGIWDPDSANPASHGGALHIYSGTDGTAYRKHTLASPLSTMYLRFDLFVHTMPPITMNPASVFLVRSATGLILDLDLFFSGADGGTKLLRFNVYHSQFVSTLKVKEIQGDTMYPIEFKWDNATTSWEVRVGFVQVGTGTIATTRDAVSIQPGFDSEPYDDTEVWMDNILIDDAAYPEVALDIDVLLTGSI